MFSLLDGYSSYNHVLPSEPDRLKTTFCMKWGMFAFRKMWFGLVNAGATFQCAMDITFRALIEQSVVVYLDNVTMLSKKRSDHLCHLKKIFEWCHKYGIFLNPKKSLFVSKDSKLCTQANNACLDPIEVIGAHLWRGKTYNCILSQWNCENNFSYAPLQWWVMTLWGMFSNW